MLEFLIANYVIFAVIGLVLLLGLFGYLMDRKKYDEYRKELSNDNLVLDDIRANPNIETVATSNDEPNRQ